MDISNTSFQNNNNNLTCVCTCSCSCSCTCSSNNNSSNDIPNGSLHIKHTGAYVARFYIYWSEPVYVGTTRTVVGKAWEYNDVHFTAPYSTTILIPMNAFNISIKAQGTTGLVWNLWHTIIDVTGLYMVPTRKVSIWGTSLNQNGSVEPSFSDYGTISINHVGSYKARFYISWDEPAVVGNNIYTTRKNWEYNGVYFTGKYFTVIPIIMTASNLSIKAEYEKAGSPQPLFNYQGLPILISRLVNLWGTEDNPKYYVEGFNG